ncbi:hypothetical protein ACJIZ3_008193 [Penstemon smallii]|uniref:Uncharacterized protein n=1 Tax=Penstemon smallii TaxID=265156 RepID=A0ABD3T9G8_9LAMI
MLVEALHLFLVGEKLREAVFVMKNKEMAKALI